MKSRLRVVDPANDTARSGYTAVKMELPAKETARSDVSGVNTVPEDQLKSPAETEFDANDTVVREVDTNLPWPGGYHSSVIGIAGA